MALLIVLLGLLVLSAVLLGVVRDLLYAAVALAAASVILSIVLFSFGANVAAAFELSVCAGLITVLFVSTVSLTKDSDQKTEAKLPALFMIPMLALFAGVAYYCVRWLAGVLPAASPARVITFQEVFWGQRMNDVLGQISLVLVGVFGLLAILRAKSAGRQHD